jgi:hypothetical protein
MPRKNPDGPDYEPFIENLTDQIDRWKASDEPTHEFARRVVGLMRMEQKKWAER